MKSVEIMFCLFISDKRDYENGGCLAACLAIRVNENFCFFFDKTRFFLFSIKTGIIWPEHKQLLYKLSIFYTKQIYERPLNQTSFLNLFTFYYVSL